MLWNKLLTFQIGIVGPIRYLNDFCCVNGLKSQRPLFLLKYTSGFLYDGFLEIGDYTSGFFQNDGFFHISDFLNFIFLDYESFYIIRAGSHLMLFDSHNLCFFLKIASCDLTMWCLLTAEIRISALSMFVSHTDSIDYF